MTAILTTWAVVIFRVKWRVFATVCRGSYLCLCWPIKTTTNQLTNLNDDQRHKYHHLTKTLHLTLDMYDYRAQVVKTSVTNNSKFLFTLYLYFVFHRERKEFKEKFAALTHSFTGCLSIGGEITIFWWGPAPTTVSTTSLFLIHCCLKSSDCQKKIIITLL